MIYINNNYIDEDSDDKEKNHDKIMRMLLSIRTLQKELARKNLTIRQLKQENALVEAKSELNDAGDNQEAVINQIISSPLLRGAILTKLQKQGELTTFDLAI